MKTKTAAIEVYTSNDGIKGITAVSSGRVDSPLDEIWCADEESVRINLNDCQVVITLGEWTVFFEVCGREVGVSFSHYDNQHEPPTEKAQITLGMKDGEPLFRVDAPCFTPSNADLKKALTAKIEELFPD